MAEEIIKRGRPLLFESAEVLEERINEYFESCFEERWHQEPIKEKNKIVGYKWVPTTDRHGNVIKDRIKPFTVTGLAIHLETSRNTLLQYEERADFVNAIKRAKDIIENYAEESLYTNKQTAGVIFNLVNNHKWINKQEVDNNHSGNMEYVVKSPAPPV